MSRHFPRRAGGLTIIQTMAILAILGVVLFFALSLLKKEMAPAATFKTLQGEQITTASLRGKVVMVNFWATSCGSCVAEMPKIAATYKAFHARGFDTVAVAMYYDPPSAVVHFTQTRGLPFQVAIDNTGQVARQWGDVAVTPTSFLVDQRGLIIKRYVGEPDFAELNRIIERLLPGA